MSAPLLGEDAPRGRKQADGASSEVDSFTDLAQASRPSEPAVAATAAVQRAAATSTQVGAAPRTKATNDAAAAVAPSQDSNRLVSAAGFESPSAATTLLASEQTSVLTTEAAATDEAGTLQGREPAPADDSGNVAFRPMLETSPVKDFGKTAAGIPKGPGTLDASRPEFANRLADSLRSAAHEGQTLRIRLNPPELGSLQIEVSMREGSVTARLDVQSAAAQRTILESLPTLRDALANHGTGISRIDVQISPPPSDDANPNFQDRDQAGTQQNGRQDGNGENRQSADDNQQQSNTQPNRPRRRAVYADQLDVAI